MNRNLIVTYTEFPPYVIDPTPPMPSGLDPALIQIMANHLGFKYTYMHANDFTQLIMFVILGTADIAITQPNFVSQRYVLGLDLSPPLTLRSFFFISRHPVPVDKLYTITYPFTETVWLVIFGTIAMIAFVIVVINR